MLKLETIKNFEGFGNGNRPDEYFYSQGMAKTRNGLSASWKILPSQDSDTLTNLDVMYWMSEGIVGGTKYVYGIDYNGRIWRKTSSGSWATTPEHLNASDTYVTDGKSYSGLMFDQKNRLIYVGQRYIGLFDGTTWYDTPSGGKGWDLGSNILSLKPISLFEDMILVGAGNKVKVIFTETDTMADGITLPTAFDIRAIKVNIPGILIGANINNRSVLVLWDAYSTRSKTDWIWLNETVKSIVNYGDGWLVITNKNIWVTNGYSIKPFFDKLLDSPLNQITITNTLLPQGAEISGKYLFFWSDSASTPNRLRCGMCALDLGSKLFEFMPVLNTGIFKGGAIFSDTNYKTNISYQSKAALKVLGSIAFSSPQKAFYITNKVGKGSNKKIAEGINLVLGINDAFFEGSAITFDVIAKIYNFKRQLWRYAYQKVLATDYNKITVNGTSFIGSAKVGDEITILSGANVGEIRNITAITGEGSATEIWTLDSNLPNYTELDTYISISPFKLIRKFSFTNITELKDIFFDIKNKVKGKKFMLKILFENITAANGLPLESQEIQFIYDDLGIF